MTSHNRMLKFALQILLGLGMAAIVITLVQGTPLPFDVPDLAVDRTSLYVLATLLLGIGVTAIFAQDKFSLYVASMFLLLSLGAVYLVVELLEFGELGALPWALIVLISVVGAIRIYFQRQL